MSKIQQNKPLQIKHLNTFYFTHSLSVSLVAPKGGSLTSVKLHVSSSTTGKHGSNDMNQSNVLFSFSVYPILFWII